MGVIVEAEIAELGRYGIDMVRRAPHLYALTAAYWSLIAGTLLTRYGLQRARTSERLMRAILVLGCAAVVLAFIDVAVRGQELIQLSLVAYFATPIGIGRLLIRKWDGLPTTTWRGLALREMTYLSAFVLFVALSAVDGDLWWFERPGVDRTDAMMLIEQTNWLHLMATVLGLFAVLEALTTGAGAVRARLTPHGRTSPRG